MALGPNRCSRRTCKYYLGFSSNEDMDAVGEDSDFGPEVCPAYPKGIPDRIGHGDNLHLTVQPDQEGMFVYEDGRVG